MRLVTYDRGGQRRLGAILEGEVVDLPDAVGHPAFPTTLEGLVSSSRGTVMHAATAALERDDVWSCRVKRPTILAPLFPTSLLAPGAADVPRRVVGPEREVARPRGAAWLEYEPRIAAVVGAESSAIDASAAASHVFGYTLVNDWSARDATGNQLYLRVKVDGTEILKGNLNGAARNLFELMAAASRASGLQRGEAYALGPFESSSPDPRRQLWPGAVVELAAEGIGTLRNTIVTG
jgi:hypothetical protein